MPTASLTRAFRPHALRVVRRGQRTQPNRRPMSGTITPAASVAAQPHTVAWLGRKLSGHAFATFDALIRTAFAFGYVNNDCRRLDAGQSARLRAAVAEPFAIEGLAITITAAIGVSASDVTDAIDPAHLLRQADERMYEAKRRRAT